jgi:hypothetical protein
MKIILNKLQVAKIICYHQDNKIQFGLGKLRSSLSANFFQGR